VRASVSTILVARTCNGCHQLLMAAEFHRNPHGIGGRMTQCKKCRKAYDTKRQPERARYMKKWRAKNGVRQHAYQVRLDYKIPIGGYLKLLEEQGGACAACRKAETLTGPSGSPRRLSVDHDHTTGRVRGLLCNACNRAIGLAKDDPTTLRRLAEYLEGAGRCE